MSSIACVDQGTTAIERPICCQFAESMISGLMAEKVCSLVRNGMRRGSQASRPQGPLLCSADPNRSLSPERFCHEQLVTKLLVPSSMQGQEKRQPDAVRHEQKQASILEAMQIVCIKC